jgi:hypothetical protein
MSAAVPSVGAPMWPSHARRSQPVTQVIDASSSFTAPPPLPEVLQQLPPPPSPLLVDDGLHLLHGCLLLLVPCLSAVEVIVRNDWSVHCMRVCLVEDEKVVTTYCTTKWFILILWRFRTFFMHAKFFDQSLFVILITNNYFHIKLCIGSYNWRNLFHATKKCLMHVKVYFILK